MAIVGYEVKPLPARGLKEMVDEKDVLDIEIFNNIALIYKKNQTMRVDLANQVVSTTYFDEGPERQITKDRREKRKNNRRGGQ